MKNILGLILIICFACKGQKEVSKATQQAMNDTLVLLIEDNYSGLSVPVNLIIKDKEMEFG